MQDIKNYSLEELKNFLEKKGLPKFYATQIFSWIYKKRVENFEAMTDLSKEARRLLKGIFYFSSLKLSERLISRDGTEKFLFNLEDGNNIETVLIPEGKRNTLCLSTQIGCRFRCKLCVSGIDGLKRNLNVSEITNQYLMVGDLIGLKKITNIVFMGIGEPLDNFDNLIKSIKIMLSPLGLYFGKRRLCISTCGLIPQMRKLLKFHLGVKLSISLHTANSDKRSRIMPVNKKYPLNEVVKLVKELSKSDKFPVTFEYVMIKDFNSGQKDALELVKLIKEIRCKLNIIPYNSSKYFSWQPPSKDDINIFQNILKKYNISFTSRKSRGSDISAACGQLRARIK